MSDWSGARLHVVPGKGGTGKSTVQGSCRSGEAGGKRGIWLILSGKKGKHPDGNLLTPVS